MKRWIHAATNQLNWEDEVPEHSGFQIPQLSDYSYLSQEKAKDVIEQFNRVYNVDPTFFDNYCSNLYTSHLNSSDRRNKASIEIYIPINKAGGVKGFKYKLNCPVSDNDILNVVDRIKKDVEGYYQNRIDKKLHKAELRKSNKQQFHAQTVFHRLMKKKFNISPRFTYSDTHKSQYMLYDLPFADEENYKLDKDAGADLRSEVKDFINNIHEKYGITVFEDMPLGGSVVRGCWTFTIYGPDFIYDKNTDTYTPVQ